MKIIFSIFFIFWISNKTHSQNTDLTGIDRRIAHNDSLLLKYNSIINVIDRNIFLLMNYNYFMDDAIKTGCVNIQSRLYNNFLIKWKEILIDYEALCKHTTLNEIDDSSKRINEYTDEIKRQILKFSLNTDINRETQVTDNYVIVVGKLKLIKDHSQLIVEINNKIYQFKSIQ